MGNRIICFTTILLLLSSCSAFADEADKSYDYAVISNDGIRETVKADHSNSAGYRFGYIDEEGNVVAECKYDYASDFINGVGILREGSTISAINTTGEVIKIFDAGYTAVSYYDGEKGIASKGGMDYIIDKDGNITSEPYQTLIFDAYSNFCGVKAKKNDKYGVITWDEKILTPFDYVNIWSNGDTTTDGLAYEKQVYGLGSYIGINGKPLFPPVYILDGFSEGLGRISKDGKYGFVDAAGNQITGLIYDNMDNYSEGLAAVMKGEKWGYIDRSGKLVIPYIYTYPSDFSGGSAVVYPTADTEVTIESPIKQSRKINVYLNDKWLYLDQEPVLENGRTLAPLRGIAEALDYYVTWDAATNSVTLQDKKRIIHLTIGDDTASVNLFDDGEAPKHVALDVPAQNINGRIMIPIRFIAENIGAEVSWDQSSHRLDVKTTEQD